MFSFQVISLETRRLQERDRHAEFPARPKPLITEDDDEAYTDEDSWNDWSKYSDDDEDEDSFEAAEDRSEG